jgi:hypothetical protein
MAKDQTSTTSQVESDSNYSPAFSAPDMTLPATVLGLLAGGAFATAYPDHAKSILTMAVSIGWLAGFSLTLFLEDW